MKWSVTWKDCHLYHILHSGELTQQETLRKKDFIATRIQNFRTVHLLNGTVTRDKPNFLQGWWLSQRLSEKSPLGTKNQDNLQQNPPAIMKWSKCWITPPPSSRKCKSIRIGAPGLNLHWTKRLDINEMASRKAWTTVSKPIGYPKPLRLVGLSRLVGNT